MSQAIKTIGKPKADGEEIEGAVAEPHTEAAQLSGNMFESNQSLSPLEVKERMHTPWPNGLEAHQHSFALLQYIETTFGSPPANISAQNIPHNSYTFKYWRSRVSPQIPDTAFVLFFLEPDKISQYIDSHTQESEPNDRQFKAEDSGAKSLAGPLTGLENFVDKFTSFTRAVEVGHSEVQGPFITALLKDNETSASERHLLTYSLNDFYHHHDARMHLADIVDEKNEAGAQLDLYLTATGYLYLDCQKLANGDLFVEEVLIKEPGSTNPVRQSFSEQAKLVLDCLVEHGVPIRTDTKIFVQPYQMGRDTKRIETTGARYKDDLSD